VEGRKELNQTIRIEPILGFQKTQTASQATGDGIECRLDY
jgi:hypothetical protein